MIKSLTTTTTNHPPPRHPLQPLMGTNILLTLKVVQLRPTLWNPIDYKVHEILQARIRQWVAIPFSSGSSQPRDRTQVSDSLPTEPQGKLKMQYRLYVYIYIQNITQSCQTLCDPMDYTVHGILQARILEWVAIPFSRGSSQPRDRTQVSDSLPTEQQGKLKMQYRLQIVYINHKILIIIFILLVVLFLKQGKSCQFETKKSDIHYKIEFLGSLNYTEVLPLSYFKITYMRGEENQEMCFVNLRIVSSKKRKKLSFQFIK